MSFRIFCCGTQAPEHMGSVVLVEGLAAPAPGRILLIVSQPRMEPVSPALQSGFVMTGPPGKSLLAVF